MADLGGGQHGGEANPLDEDLVMVSVEQRARQPFAASALCGWLCGWLRGFVVFRIFRSSAAL